VIDDVAASRLGRAGAPVLHHPFTSTSAMSVVWLAHRASKVVVKFLSSRVVRVLRRVVVGVLFACIEVWAQQEAPPSNPGFAAISNIRLEHAKAGSTLEITATRPVTPQIQEIDSPPRIMIDLPNSRVAVRSKRIKVKADKIAAIRVDQFQERPPVTRVVVDLLAPHKFEWNVRGNVLVVKFEPAAPVPETPRVPTVSGLREEAKPVAVPVSAAIPGAVMLEGSRLAAGDSVTAGVETATLQLARGGDVRVCPGTTVSVTPSPNGHDLMLALSTGAIETHYQLDAAGDSVLTPDFRVQFPGPGEFDYAISADAHGNTCVRSLMGNTGLAIVSELMSDRTYLAKPTDQLMFHSGSLDRVDAAVPVECGCPPAAPVMRATSAPSPAANTPASAQLAAGKNKLAAIPDASKPKVADATAPEVSVSIAGTETAPLPQTKKEDIQVRVEAPIVFRASDLPPAGTTSSTGNQVTVTKSNAAPQSDPTTPIPSKPPPTTVTVKNVEHKGFFGKIGGFFASIFK
jgi:hypothetical protein